MLERAWGPEIVLQRRRTARGGPAPAAGLGIQRAKAAVAVSEDKQSKRVICMSRVATAFYLPPLGGGVGDHVF